MACISAQTGTLIFAIINLVKVTGAILYLIGRLVYWALKFADEYTPGASLESTIMPVRQMAFTLLFLFMWLIILLFSSFLMNGIRKKKPEHIKVFFIFGIVKLLMGLLILLILFSSGVALHFYVYIIILVQIIFYSLILYMIRYTYLQLETINKQFNHERLPEKC